MKKLISLLLLLSVTAASAVPSLAETKVIAAGSSDSYVEEDVFAGWNEDAPALQELLDYVNVVTDDVSDDYIPPEDRIAVFDMDGTLYGELFPTYLEYYMLAWRILEDPSLQPDEEMLAVAREIRDSVDTADGVVSHDFASDLPIRHAVQAARAYAGMTMNEFADFVTEILLRDVDGFEGMTYGEAFYQPMIEVVEYLQENDFKVFVVSGSDRFICRTLIEGYMDIPAENIIGMDVAMVATGQGDTDGLEYVFDPENDELVRSDQLLIKNLKMNKVSQIARDIGRQPVLSFGNSSGDVSMHNYTLADNPYRSEAFMLIADDEERDYGNYEKVQELRQKWEESGYNVISMKDDFRTIYGDDVVKTGSFRWAEELADENAEGLNAEDVSADELSVEDVNPEDLGAEDMNIEGMSAGETSAEDMRAEGTGAEDMRAEDVSAGDMSAEDMSAEDMSAEDMSAGDMSAENVSAEDVNAEDVSAEDLSVEDLDAEEYTADAEDPYADTYVQEEENPYPSAPGPLPGYPYAAPGQGDPYMERYARGQSHPHPGLNAPVPGYPYTEKYKPDQDDPYMDPYAPGQDDPYMAPYVQGQYDPFMDLYAHGHDHPHPGPYAPQQGDPYMDPYAQERDDPYMDPYAQEQNDPYMDPYVQDRDDSYMNPFGRGKDDSYTDPDVPTGEEPVLPDGEDADIQYVMYLGTNDKDTNEPVFTPDEAKEKAREILVEHFGGYTIQEAEGGWVGDDGTLYQEYTLVIYLSDTTEEDVHEAADELIDVFRQSSVLIQANRTRTEFYSGIPA